MHRVLENEDEVEREDRRHRVHPALMKAPPVDWLTRLFQVSVVVLLLANALLNVPQGTTLYMKQGQLGSMIDNGAVLTETFARERHSIVHTLRKTLGLVNRMVGTLDEANTTSWRNAVESLDRTAEVMGSPDFHEALASAVTFFTRSTDGLSGASSSATQTFHQVSAFFDAFSEALSRNQDRKLEAPP